VEAGSGFFPVDSVFFGVEVVGIGVVAFSDQFCLLRLCTRRNRRKGNPAR